VTIHDLNHLRIPEVGGSSMRRAYIRRWIWDAIRGAAAVVTGSHHAREDIIREFGCPPDRISVIGNGISQSWIPLEESKLEERLARMKIRHPYLVSVGNSKPHKNISWMVQEVTKWLDRQGLPHGIVLTSPAGKLPGRGARVVHTGPLDQSDMRAIIQGAAALIQPSLYEGFGLPVIEAQALKTPVLVSTAASLPEVSGGTSSACLFDPRSPLELAGALERGLDPSNRIALVTAGLANAQSHTWDAVAERLLSVWHWVLRNHP
jgi:glycosyltransferase involved in cell wall biosynthesis